MPRKQGVGMPKRNKKKVEGPGQLRSSGGRPPKQRAHEDSLEEPGESSNVAVMIDTVQMQLAEVSVAPTAEMVPAELTGSSMVLTSAEPNSQLPTDSESELEPDSGPSCGHDHGPCWARRPVYIQKLRRVYGSWEAYSAIFEVVALETWSLRKDESKMDEDDKANKATSWTLK